jgi:hypothetical protein
MHHAVILPELLSGGFRSIYRINTAPFADRTRPFVAVLVAYHDNIYSILEQQRLHVGSEH